MSDANKRFSHESMQDAKTLKTLLTALAKGFSKGEMTLGDDEDELVLTPKGLLTVRIKGERRDGRCEVDLKVTWSDPSQPEPRKGSPRIES